MERVIIIGGGASGLMAAITAAEGGKREVIVLERQQRVGRKLLASGNGRCNLTNTGTSIKNYHGENVDFARPALDAFTAQDTLEFFHSLGLLTVEEYGGRVYPLSNSANSVLDVMRLALEARGVELRCASTVKELKRHGSKWSVCGEDFELIADKVIVACGGMAGAKLGGVRDGYELLKPLGHKRGALYPSLVQLITSNEYPRALKGIRTDCRLSLTFKGETLAESRGELQFTEKGVSGPAAFDLSRSAATASKGAELCADFFADYSQEDILSVLLDRQSEMPMLPCADMLIGLLHNRLGKMLVKYASIDAASPISALSYKQLRTLVRACKCFRLELCGTEGFDNAQVTAGGVLCSSFKAESLESLLCPGLFVCGELLDIDGDCGGFNLQWAWASGRLAGRLGK